MEFSETNILDIDEKHLEYYIDYVKQNNNNILKNFITWLKIKKIEYEPKQDLLDVFYSCDKTIKNL